MDLVGLLTPPHMVLILLSILAVKLFRVPDEILAVDQTHYREGL